MRGSWTDHHRSTRMTWFAEWRAGKGKSGHGTFGAREDVKDVPHVRLRPVLPALKEMRMTLVCGSFLIASRDTCRFASGIEPSSGGDKS